MADRQDNTPRKARQNERNSKKDRSAHRHSEENLSNTCPSHDQSLPITSQTQVISIPHTGGQSHPPMDVDITQGNANAQTVQSHGNSEAGDQQLATGSSVNVVDNKGPTQLGERSTVIYNITNHFHCSHQPPHHQSNAPYHNPTHCAPCLHYHHNDHQLLAEHNGQHQEAQHRHLLPSQNPVPQLLPSEQTEQPAARQTEQDETNTPRGHITSRTKTQSQIFHPGNQTVGQSVKKSGQSVPVSDVTSNVTHAEKGAKKSAEPEVASNEVPKSRTSQGVSRSSETRQVSDDEVTDNVTIIDSKGRRLIPGDVVFCSVDFAIYTGNQCIVWCKETGQVVESGTLDMTRTFEKCRITSGKWRVFPPMERVQRAVSRVGRRFTEGGGKGAHGLYGLYGLYGWDFTCWVTTGFGEIQARMRGFELDPY